MLVIDTSALVEVLTTDPADIPGLARRVHDVEWMSAPSLIDYEVLNVLRKLVLRGTIDAELAEDSRRTCNAEPTRHDQTKCGCRTTSVGFPSESILSACQT